MTQADPPPEEIELKLTLTPEALARLPRTALVRSLKTDRPRRRQLASTYYDTPSLVLQRHGMALRVRHDGDGYVQTLKAPLTLPRNPDNGAGQGGDGAGRTGLQHLREYEAPLDGAAVPDLSLIADDELQAFFARENVARELEPVFTTEFERQLLPLALADAEIELALDRGRIVSGEAAQELCEAELELKRGQPGRLYELAMLLRRRSSFRLEQASKAERGYRLYAGTWPQPRKAEKPRVSSEMAAATAFEVLARPCLRQMRANEQPVLDGTDPEGVHQMRVAIRRLRALVTAFKPLFAAEPYDTLRGELKWLQNRLGPARDWDVFLLETLAPLRQRLPSEDSLQALETAARALREEAYATARETVLSDRYTDLLLRLQLWLEEGGWRRTPGPGETDPGARPVAAFARDILDSRAKKLKKLGRKHAELSETQLHELRIRGKKLRYAAEFFAGAFAKKSAKDYLARLEAIQDRLGALNDAATGQRLLDQLDRRLRAEGADTVAASATGIVLGWQACRMDRELAAFDGTWTKFAKAKAFWR